MAKLGDICEINPKPEKFAQDFPVSYVPMPYVSEDGEIQVNDVRLCSTLPKGLTSFCDGDVLLAKITPCLENGKGAIARGLMNGQGRGSTEFHILRPNKAITTSEWIYLYTKWDAFRKAAEQNMTGSAGQKRVPTKFLQNCEIPLPALPIQIQQTGVIGHIQKLIITHKNQLAKLDQLVKSRYAELFGSLRDTKYKIETLGNLCEFIKDGTHQTPTYTDDKRTGVKFLSSKDVVTKHICWENVKYIPQELHEVLSSTVKPQKGDLLLAKNGTTGYAAIVDTDEVFDIYVSLALLRFKTGNDIYYLWAAVNSHETKFQFDSSLKGIGVPNLHLGEIKKTRIIAPPLDLQTSFAAFLQRTDTAKSTIRASIAHLETLKNSLMQRYFAPA